MPPDVSEQIASLGEALAGCAPVVFAYLIGGAARGEMTPRSDVDVVSLITAPTSLACSIRSSGGP